MGIKVIIKINQNVQFSKNENDVKLLRRTHKLTINRKSMRKKIGLCHGNRFATPHNKAKLVHKRMLVRKRMMIRHQAIVFVYALHSHIRFAICGISDNSLVLITHHLPSNIFLCGVLCLFACGLVRLGSFFSFLWNMFFQYSTYEARDLYHDSFRP